MISKLIVKSVTMTVSSPDKPHNPMLNGGAIMSCALTLQLIQPRTNLAEKYDFLFQSLHRIAGYEFLGFNNSVFLSERETADRNFAMVDDFLGV